MPIFTPGEFERHFGACGNGASDDTDAFNNVCREFEKDNRNWLVRIDPESRYGLRAPHRQWEQMAEGVAVGQVLLPALDLSTQAPRSLTFECEVPPVASTNWWPGDHAPVTQSGAVIESHETPLDYWNAMFTGSAKPREGQLWNKSACRVSFRNIVFRNSKSTCLDLKHMGYIDVSGCIFDTGEDLNMITEPSNFRAGLVCPGQGNWVEVNVDNNTFVGMGLGVQISEHFDGGTNRMFLCKVGVQFLGGSHAVSPGRFRMVGCPICVDFYDHKTRFLSPLCLDRERTNGFLSGDQAWTNGVADINDWNNLGAGEVTFVGVLSNADTEATFTMNGGANLTVTNVGAL